MTGQLRNCFTYGSLMTKRIMSSVCGIELEALPARLMGFSRHPVRGEDYPGIVPASAAEVSGVLYLAVPPDALAKLDAFEGEQYLRCTVSVDCGDCQQRPAEVYVFQPEHAHLLQPGDWDVAAFEREGRARFEQKFAFLR